MPNYSKDTQEKFIDRIREVMIILPNASVRRIQDELATNKDNPLLLHRTYLTKLVDKIHGERKHRLDKAFINKRLAELEDTTRALTLQNWKIALDPTSTKKEKILALREIREAEHKLLTVQMDAGIYQDKDGKQVKTALRPVLVWQQNIIQKVYEARRISDNRGSANDQQGDNRGNLLDRGQATIEGSIQTQPSPGIAIPGVMSV